MDLDSMHRVSIKCPNLSYTKKIPKSEELILTFEIQTIFYILVHFRLN